MGNNICTITFFDETIHEECMMDYEYHRTNELIIEYPNNIKQWYIYDLHYN